MKRGTTYTRIVTIPNWDLRTATEVVVSVKPMGKVPIEITQEHMSVTSDGTDTTIAYRLTQEQSLSMVTDRINSGYVEVDINWTIDGTRCGIKDIDRITITRTLLNRLMEGVVDEYNPDYVDPDISVLPAEDVRVVNAVSPHVTLERGDDCVIMTVRDIDGTHVIEIPDGQQGPQGEQGPQGIQGEQGEQGETGATGATGNGIASITLNQDYTLTIRYTNGNSYTTASIRGEQGERGPAGADGTDGFSPTASVSKSGDTATITITDKQGTTTATVTDGQDGTNGTNGTNGTDGTNAYVYIRYAANEPTADSDMKTTPDAWIGIYSGDSASAPTHYTDYAWYKIKGETGAAGQVQDVQVNGTSVVTSGVANVPIGSASALGVVKYLDAYGISITGNGQLILIEAADNDLKRGYAGSRRAIFTGNQHKAAFFGFAKAAGADMTNLSSVTVGEYPEAQKSAISEMLNGSVSVTGSTPSITAKSGIRYVCGEISTLALTLPASGIVDVVFESGSTATVLTITPPSGVTAVKWADGWDETCEANTTYEINILNGELGVKAAWT